MDTNEISAFEAYASKKPKHKHGNSAGPKLKPKNKLKKKKKSINNVNGTLNSIIQGSEFNQFDIKKNKNVKHFSEKKNLIKSLLRAEKESLFKDCSLTTKVDNMFLSENMSEESSKKHKIKGNNKKLNRVTENEFKKSSKKLLFDEQLESLNNSKEKDKNENSFYNEDVNHSVLNDVEIENEMIKSSKKKKLKEKNKLPNIIYSDSVKVGEEVLSWILSPLSLKDFFKNCWEQKPLHIKHNNENYFNCLCSLKDFNNALIENDMYFTRNIDVTSYVNGERFTENPEGKAKSSVVWDLYNNGRSIRLLNPQTFIPNIRLLNTTLQEFFHCFVGANIYLTPAGTQGFAPHYDDIEAFVLQLEGEKHWKLYNPRTPDEVLPRESSRNFTEDEIGEPILEVTLKPGDLLYFPRGIIHQARCLPHVHSLHVTVSCYQKNSWADLFEKIIPVALQRAINENVEFRKGLPIGYLNHLGMVHCDRESEQKQEMLLKFDELALKVLEYCPLDAAVDQLGAKFTHDALPPCLAEEEKNYGASRDVSPTDKCLLEVLKNCTDKGLSVKLIRATSVRLVSEQDEMVLYYTTDNSLVYQEHEVQRVSVPTYWAQAIDYLIRSYPKFVEIQELPVSNKINKPGKWKRIAEFVYFLWQKGLLLFDRPLQQVCS